MTLPSTPIDILSESALQAFARGEQYTVYVPVTKPEEALLDKSVGNPGCEIQLGVPFPMKSHVWVRETWHGPVTRDGKLTERCAANCLYKSTDPFALEGRLNARGNAPAEWRKGQQMPRWASRFTCEVMSVCIMTFESVPEHEKPFVTPKRSYVVAYVLSPVSQ